MNFYRGKRWERLRARVLKRDEYICREHRRYGKRVTATTVHHVWPREDCPQYEYESWNLASLCTDCHNAMHNRQDNSLTERGQMLRDRTPPPKKAVIYTQETEGPGVFPIERVPEKFF